MTINMDIVIEVVVKLFNPSNFIEVTINRNTPPN